MFVRFRRLIDIVPINAIDILLRITCRSSIIHVTQNVWKNHVYDDLPLNVRNFLWNFIEQARGIRRKTWGIKKKKKPMRKILFDRFIAMLCRAVRGSTVWSDAKDNKICRGRRFAMTSRVFIEFWPISGEQGPRLQFRAHQPSITWLKIKVSSKANVSLGWKATKGIVELDAFQFTWSRLFRTLLSSRPRYFYQTLLSSIKFKLDTFLTF